MIARLLGSIFAILLPLGMSGEAAAFEYGLRPPDAVFDPGGFLDPELKREISAPLLKIRKSEGIDVVVVVLGDMSGASAETEARRVADAWCESTIHAVVLHVIGDPDSPWIVPAGELIGMLDAEQVAETVAEARRRAALEPGEPGKVRAAAIEAADMLRYWMNNVINRAAILETERTIIRTELEKKAHERRIAMWVGLAAMIPILAAGVLFFQRRRGPFPRYFPEIQSPRRLGAPHAGGNSAVVDLGPPLP